MSRQKPELENSRGFHDMAGVMVHSVIVALQEADTGGLQARASLGN